jgi:hypothetical protein
MSEALLCDVCGQVALRSVAPRNGWLTVAALADLSAVVPDDHPLHRARHLCSTDCFGVYARAVSSGSPLSAASQRTLDGAQPISLGMSVAAGITSSPPEPLPPPRILAPDVAEGGEPAPVRRLARRQARRSDTATAAPTTGTTGTGTGAQPAGGRLSQLVDSAHGDAVDLRAIASKPAPRRRAT